MVRPRYRCRRRRIKTRGQTVLRLDGRIQAKTVRSTSLGSFMTMSRETVDRTVLFLRMAGNVPATRDRSVYSRFVVVPSRKPRAPSGVAARDSPPSRPILKTYSFSCRDARRTVLCSRDRCVYSSPTVLLLRFHHQAHSAADPVVPTPVGASSRESQCDGKGKTGGKDQESRRPGRRAKHGRGGRKWQAAQPLARREARDETLRKARGRHRTLDPPGVYRHGD